MTAYRAGQVALRYRLEAAELLERPLRLQRALLKRSHAVAALVACSLSAVLVLRSGESGAVGAVGLLALAAVVQRMIVRRRTNPAMWSEATEGFRDVVLEANPQQLHFSMGATELRFDWAQLHGWARRDGALILYPDEVSSLTVPARAFPSAESREVLSQLLSTQVGAPEQRAAPVHPSGWLPIVVYSTLLLLMIGTCIETTIHVFWP